MLARLGHVIDLDWIPRPWGDEIAAELKSARSAASQPLKPSAVERVLRDAWGTKPTDELDDFDPIPVAVTPTSQVHKGTLDGAAVAVKVLRPGVKTTVRQDLQLLDALRSPIRTAFPAADVTAILRELRARVLDELDLESEASTQRRFHRALRGHPWLIVPAPVMRLAHEHVLVSEWIEGSPLSKAPDLDQAVRRLVLFNIGAALSGILHVDPDPGDVRVLADGRLAILDFGAWREVEPERVALARDALEAFLARERDAFVSAIEGLGWLPSSLGAAALELAEEVLGEFGHPGALRLDGDAVIAARDRLLGRERVTAELVRAGALPPHDLWPVRGVAQLFALIARLGASGEWLELSRSALRDGWSSTLGA
ncbi:MAG: AarF/UbiB family protein [Solirubrobacteraceae bacterium]